MIWWMLIAIWLVGIPVFLVLSRDFRFTPWYWIGGCVLWPIAIPLANFLIWRQRYG